MNTFDILRGVEWKCAICDVATRVLIERAPPTEYAGDTLTILFECHGKIDSFWGIPNIGLPKTSFARAVAEWIDANIKPFANVPMLLGEFPRVEKPRKLTDAEMNAIAEKEWDRFPKLQPPSEPLRKKIEDWISDEMIVDAALGKQYRAFSNADIPYPSNSTKTSSEKKPAKPAKPPGIAIAETLQRDLVGWRPKCELCNIPVWSVDCIVEARGEVVLRFRCHDDAYVFPIPSTSMANDRRTIARSIRPFFGMKKGATAIQTTIKPPTITARPIRLDD